jgi:4-hydroxy-tetrahydrodipicolinate reductase
MRVSVLGATGALGRLVVKALSYDEEFTIANKVSSKSAISDLFQNADVIIDFSCPIATEAMLRYALEHASGIPIVIGTTGLSKLHNDLMIAYTANAPVFYSPNMSFLVALLNATVSFLATFLDDDFDVEILDVHHRYKKDAPSGTALMLGKTIAKARNHTLEDIATFARYGIVKQRQRGEIGFSTQRCGDVVGIHEIGFIGDSENIKIKHEAQSKEIFAKGAVLATKWIAKQSRGMYSMNDFMLDIIKPTMRKFCERLYE